MQNEKDLSLFGELPLSPLLDEVKIDSLDELMSRHPEKMTDQERYEIVKILRAQSVKWEEDEMTGKHKKVRKAEKTSPLLDPSEDLGL